MRQPKGGQESVRETELQCRMVEGLSCLIIGGEARIMEPVRSRSTRGDWRQGAWGRKNQKKCTGGLQIRKPRTEGQTEAIEGSRLGVGCVWLGVRGVCCCCCCCWTQGIRFHVSDSLIPARWHAAYHSTLDSTSRAITIHAVLSGYLWGRGARDVCTRDGTPFGRDDRPEPRRRPVP